ncbi:MAG: 2-C-methyl-D-erythritol 4-phosphate cytidylyltransferase [Mycoplasmataceae bacterium]|nr:2-C-methyl-D-erythritol 4-phosphate cytidylyltransferase [Mycoplasmataceae bacterium]MBR3571273.1 2-C-methyl-D-erythritol 4-phosphate cytidylyltransferase [Mycoplasmataceae bacterium]MBR4025921.1 2-C-methyl-D-erythritol 4-phosphate cytidylyltransferase [Mycoplasmataceae bacterium]
MNYMILLAGGIGSRTKLKIPKQYYEIDGESIINYLLKNIKDELDKIFVVCDLNYKNTITQLPNVVFVKNGNTRLESLKNGIIELKKIAKDGDLIFIHEAARALLDKRDLDLHKNNARINQGLITNNVVFDTMFKINEEKEILEVIQKQNIVAGYNPQSFYWDDLKKYKDDILDEQRDLDLSEILIKKNFKIKVLEQISNLRKITIKEDLEWLGENIKWKK